MTAAPGAVQHCRSCDAPIIWALTERGRRIPLDAVPTTGAILVPGTPPTAKFGPVYVSHFATCPNADQHRKPKAVDAAPA